MYRDLWITQERERGFPKDIRFKNFKRVVVHSSPWLDFGLKYCLKLHLLTLKLLLENFQNLWNKIVLIYCERCTVVVIHKHSFGLVYVKDLSRTIVTTLPPLPMLTSTNNYNVSQKWIWWFFKIQMSKCFQSNTFKNNWQNQKTYKEQELFTIHHILVGHPITPSTSLFRDWMELGIIFIYIYMSERGWKTPCSFAKSDIRCWGNVILEKRNIIISKFYRKVSK